MKSVIFVYFFLNITQVLDIKLDQKLYASICGIISRTREDNRQHRRPLRLCHSRDDSIVHIIEEVSNSFIYDKKMPKYSTNACKQGHSLFNIKNSQA
jgi:hypothetical protein